MKTTLKFIMAAACAVVLAACNPQPPVEVFDNPPTWRVSEADIDISSTMNIIAAVEGVDMTMDDVMAAFSDSTLSTCLGVCKPVITPRGLRFYLGIYKPASKSQEITLAYYSCVNQKLYYWFNQILFEPDKVVGLASEPYMLPIPVKGE